MEYRLWEACSEKGYCGALEKISFDEIPGDYKLINHGKDISSGIKTSQFISLLEGGQISGEVRGTWNRSHGNFLTVELDGVGTFVQRRRVSAVRWNRLLAGDSLACSTNSIARPPRPVKARLGRAARAHRVVANAVEPHVVAGHETSFCALPSGDAVLDWDGAIAALTACHRHTGNGVIVDGRPVDLISSPGILAVPRP